MDVANAALNAVVMVAVLSIFAYLGRERFELLGRRIDGLAGETRRGFDRVDKQFEQVDKRFEQVDKRFEQVDKRFEQVDRRFEQVEQRFLRVEGDLAAIRSDLTRVALAVGARREPNSA